MPPVKVAFDVAARVMMVIADLDDTTIYKVHKPRLPPFQDPSFKSRVLWENISDGHVAWMQQGKVLIVHPAEVEQDEHDTHALAIGEFINDYKFDKAVYAAALASHGGGSKRNAASVIDSASKKMKKSTAVAPQANVPTTAEEKQQDTAAAEEAAAEGAVEEIAAEGGVEEAAAEGGVEEAAAEGGVDFEMRAAISSGIAKLKSAGISKVVDIIRTEMPDICDEEGGEIEIDVNALNDKTALRIYAFLAQEAVEAAADEAVQQEAAKTVAEGPAPEAAVEEEAAKEAPVDPNLKLIAELQSKLDDERQRAEEAESATEKARKTHKNYIATKQREMKKMGTMLQAKEDELKAAPSQSELDRLKSEVHNQKITMSDEEYAAAMNSKANPAIAYQKLLVLCNDSIDAAIAAQSQGSSSTRTAFEYKDNSGSWVEISDPTVTSALTSLMSTGKKVTYSFGGQNYEASLASGNGKSKKKEYEIEQKNIDPQFQTVRHVRDTSHHNDSKATTKKILAEVLYGSKSCIELTEETIDAMLDGYRMNVPQSYEYSLELAKLAEKFSSIGSAFKYVVPAGTQPSASNAVKMEPNSDGTNDFQSEVFVKPIALFNWLYLAKVRGYRTARIVMHGGSKEAYAGLRSDPIGFNLKFAGRNGQAFGNGGYFALSDHATVGYNQPSGLPPGSAILALLLTNESIGWQHHHGGYTSGVDSEAGLQYKTITFSTPVEGIDNAIVVHEMPLALPIGLVNAYDKTRGWVMAADAYGLAV